MLKQPEEKELVFDTGLDASLKQAVKPNYLGSPEVVQALLRELGTKATKRFDPKDAPGSVTKDIHDCKLMADIFLGKNEDYASIPHWNDPIHIVSWVTQHSDVKGENPDEIMASVFVNFLVDVYGLYNYAANGALPEAWEWQVNAICETYTNLLLGILVPTVDEAFLASRQDE